MLIVAEHLRDNLGNITGLKYPDGEVFDGELDSNNNPDGFGTLKASDGNIICEGYFYNDVFDYIIRYNKDRKKIIQPIK